MKATITLEYGDEQVAESVTAAVSPDNFKTPKDLAVRTKLVGSTVVTEITFEGKIATFIATIDDLLFCASVAENTLKTVQG